MALPWLRKLAIASVAAVLIFYLLMRPPRSLPGVHIVQPENVVPTISEGISMSHQDTEALCQKHNFAPFLRARKVYDLFLISTELDWLEIRLNELSPYVDYFVIVEGTRTFTGIAKPLYLKDNWDRFKPFHSKIIHRVVEDPGSVVGSRAWDHEDYMRNALFDHVFPGLKGTSQEAHTSDVLIVSDIDEIPRPETISVLRHCDFPARLTLGSHFYYYSFQWRHRGPEWAHPQATVFRGLQGTIRPTNLRNGDGNLGWFFLGAFWRHWEKDDLWNAAWHCSSCFATIEEMRGKMQSFSHTNWNTEYNRKQDVLIERIRNGKDLFGREGEFYDRVDNNIMIPKYLAKNAKKFGYMLDRDGPDAGFVDIKH